MKFFFVHNMHIIDQRSPYNRVCCTNIGILGSSAVYGGDRPQSFYLAIVEHLQAIQNDPHTPLGDDPFARDARRLKFKFTICPAKQRIERIQSRKHSASRIDWVAVVEIDDAGFGSIGALDPQDA